MRRLFLSEFITLDGVIQAPGGSDEDMEDGFQHGGWQEGLFDDAMGTAVTEYMAESGGFVLGRKTYQIFAGYWPKSEDEFAHVMNDMPKHVASTTLRPPLEWENSTLLEGGLGQAITALKEQEGKDLQVIGSGNLAASLMELGLVDEIRLMIHPLVLGTGKRLFPEGVPRMPLRLLNSSTTSTGVLIVTYGMESPGDRVA